jgi:peptidyl-prolyl cis-trans isomerase C
MRFVAGIFLFASLACAQTVPPPSAAAPPALTAQPTIPPDSVVATVGGKKYTAAELNTLISGFPPQVQNAIRSDPKQFLPRMFMLKYLAEEGEKAGLDKKTPYKEGLAYQRVSILSQAEITEYRNNIDIKLEDQEKYYRDNPQKYEQANVKVIYVAFTMNPATPAAGTKKPLTESEAKTKAEDLRKQIEAGADFAKLARENSDDKESASKDGDYGTISRNSPYPEAIKNAVFALKPGQTSQPLRQPNGYYLIRVVVTTRQPYEQVRTQIYEELKQERFNAWLKGIEQRYQVQVDNPAFFAPPAAH